MTMLLFLIGPIAVILLAQRVPLLDRIGVVPLTFLLGFLIAILLPVGRIWPPGAQQTVAEVSVALALPLIIFAANIRRATVEARGMFLAMALALISVIAASLLGAALFRGQIAALPQVAGLSVGAYTGSGVNMAAINTALDGDQAVFLTMITYDIVFSTLYMAVVLLAGQRLAGLVLRPYTAVDSTGENGALAHLADDSAHGYRRILARGAWASSALALAAAVAIVGASVGISRLFPEGAASVVTILSITTLSLIGSLIPRLNRAPASFHLGMVLILIFCLASATMLDMQIFYRMDWMLGGYFLFVIFGSMLIQLVLSRMAGLDRDTYLIASGAAVMSVPFIPMIAGALKNRALIVPGMAIAVLGYAVGNYLGIMVARLVGLMG